MPSNYQPDLLVLLTALLAAAFSPQLAAVLAPYVVIILGALLGTAWGLKRRAPAGSGHAWAFVALMLATAFIFTMPAALWLQRYTGGVSYQWLLGPIAAIIGAVGEDWPHVGSWAAGFVRRALGKQTGTDEA